MSESGTPTTLRCGVFGYGTRYDFGKWHGIKIGQTDGLELAAIFSRSKERTDAAKADFPDVATYNDIDTMVDEAGIDVAIIVTPPRTHAPLVTQCLRAGKHVVVEKPMCMTVGEADAMIEAAKQADRTLAMFHNRRRDGNFQAIKKAVDDGSIGDIFHAECTSYNWECPAVRWDADKEVSGGRLYLWAPHAIDWVLQLIPSKVKYVTGFEHKVVWHHVTSEDHNRAILHFENGAVAEVSDSRVARIPKPLWYILGSKGAITDHDDDSMAGYYFEAVGHSKGSFRMVTERDGDVVDEQVPYAPSDWVQFYEAIAAHLLHGAPKPVSPEEGRRVIAVIEAAGRSAKSGRPEPVAYE